MCSSKYRLAVVLAALLLSSCAATYRPLVINQKTGYYGSVTKVKSGVISQMDTSFDLRQYRFVYLTVSSDYYIGRLDFMVRQVLFNLGLRHVVNQEELVLMIKDNEQLSSIGSVSDPLALSRLSEQVGPILSVSFESLWVSSSGTATVTITDLSSNKKLLSANNSGLIWTDYASEILYPVFNAMKKWADDSMKGQVGI